MTDKVVYKSTHPDVLAHWDRETAAREEWKQQIKAVAKRWGIGNATSINLSLDDYPYAAVMPDLDIPYGWRRDQRKGWLVPAKGLKAGKEIAAEMRDLRCPNPARNLPGNMPYVTFSSLSLVRLRPKRIGGVVFAEWAAEPDDADRIDPQVWERIKLSEFYAAIEAQSEAAS